MLVSFEASARTRGPRAAIEAASSGGGSSSVALIVGLLLVAAVFGAWIAWVMRCQRAEAAVRRAAEAVAAKAAADAAAAARAAMPKVVRTKTGAASVAPDAVSGDSAGSAAPDAATGKRLTPLNDRPRRMSRSRVSSTAAGSVDDLTEFEADMGGRRRRVPAADLPTRPRTRRRYADIPLVTSDGGEPNPEAN